MTTHSVAARNAATDAVTGLIGTSAALKLHAAGSTVGTPGAAIATLPLTTPTAFAAASAGVATANPITTDGNTGAGTVAFASIQTSGGVAVIHCPVSEPAGGGEAELSGGLTFEAGDQVSCASLTYAALAQ